MYNKLPATLRRGEGGMVEETRPIYIQPRLTKLVADQLGHGLDTNQNVYTQTSVETRLEAVETLSAFVN
jgi:hypothetical protein